MAIVKVATYNEFEFYEKICKYSRDWLFVSGGFRPEVEKYALTDVVDGDKIILTVSHSFQPPEAKAPYNCIFHSWSKSALTAKKVLDDFLKKAGFEPKPAPENIDAMFTSLDQLMDAMLTQ